MAGEEIDPDGAEWVIEAAGRTAEQFADEVGHRLTRLQLRKKADKLPEAAAEVRRLQAEFDQVGVDWNTELEKVNKNFFARREQTKAKQDAAAARKKACEDAERYLARMVPDDDPRKARLQAIGAELADIEHRLMPPQRESVYAPRYYLDHYPADEKIAGRDDNRRAKEHTLADSGRIISELEGRTAALKAARAAINADMYRA